MAKAGNKIARTVLIVAAVVVAVFVIARLSGALVFYKVANTANAPALKLDSYAVVSNLKSPQRGDHIVFKWETPEMGKHRRVYRLIGMEGDTIAVKAGLLYVNDKGVTGFPVLYHYKVRTSDLRSVMEADEIDMQEAAPMGPDSISINLSDQFVAANKLPAERVIMDKNAPADEIMALWGHPWNPDHFGPVIVPPGKCFVLGDNRYGAHDSRYTGFIDKKAITGTIILH